MIGSIGYHLIPGRTPLLGGWEPWGSISILQTKEEAFQFLKMDVRRTNSELYYVAGRADSSDKYLCK